jgi:predicted dithiol-disulfide oxidoreductase (DUF899 family)
VHLKERMGFEMPWYTFTDSFDSDFGVDNWAGHNAFIHFMWHAGHPAPEQCEGCTWVLLSREASR